MQEKKNRILIVNPLFRDLFLLNCKEVLKNEYEVDEFLQQNNVNTTWFNYMYHKLLNLFNIYFLKDKDYYNRLEKKRQKKYYLLCLKKIKNINYEKILFCRGDRIPSEILKALQKHSENLINYQCDGVILCPTIFKKKHFFNKIYSFEKEDIVNYPDLKMDFITNFFFKYKPLVNNTKLIDFYYLGVGLKERITILNNFSETFINFNNLFFVSSGKPEALPKNITPLTKVESYQSNLNQTINSRYLLDLKMDVHNGLSFRFFESLYFQKKLITNNKDVINYDFYHSNNILIVDFDNIIKDDIERFLQLDYIEIDQNIVDKYSFDNWLKRILEIN